MNTNIIYFHEYHVNHIIEAEWHICISKLTIIGSDNVLLRGRHQATMWTNAGMLGYHPTCDKPFSQPMLE